MKRENIRRAFIRKSPEILTGFGIAGMLTSTILAVVKTPEALSRMDEARKQNDGNELTVWQKVRACGKCYILPAAISVVSSASLIASCKISSARNEALLAAYEISEQTLRDYRANVIRQIGEVNEREIHHKTALEQMEKTKTVAEAAEEGNKELIVAADGSGPDLCYDLKTGRYFYCYANQIEAAINKVNHELITGIDTCVSLNDFYNYLGLSSVDMGRYLGWNTDRGLAEIYIDGDARKGNFGLKGVITIDYNALPGYDRL